MCKWIPFFNELAFMVLSLTVLTTQSLQNNECGDKGCLINKLSKSRFKDEGLNLQKAYPDDMIDDEVEYVVSDKYPFIVLPIDRTGRFDMINPAMSPKGLPILEGDILYDPEEDEAIPDTLDRKFIPSDKFLWPNDPFTGWPTIPFRITRSAESSRSTILDAIALWENNTCITFREEFKPLNACHISFVEDSGCWSYVGRQYKKEGPQSLSVGSGCRRMGTIAHEVGHAIGLLHEQSRSDRDDYVLVIWDNIRPTKLRNFKKRPSDNENVPYDTSSIMHYGGFFFTNTGAMTLLTKNPFHQWHLGQRERLTFRDSLIVNTMYGCLARWSEECKNTSTVCENGGFLDRNCNCSCPPGTKGERCQNIYSDYYPELECGGNVTSPLNISSPSYPEQFPAESWCMWWAQADKCQQVKLTFHDFELLYRSRNRCYWDTIEIRDVDPLIPGKVFCESEIKQGREFISKNGSLFITFYGKYTYARGFSATIDFIKDKTCGKQGST